MFLSIACLQIGPRMLTDGLVSNKRTQGKLEASSISTRYKDTFGKEKQSWELHVCGVQCQTGQSCCSQGRRQNHCIAFHMYFAYFICIFLRYQSGRKYTEKVLRFKESSRLDLVVASSSLVMESNCHAPLGLPFSSSHSRLFWISCQSYFLRKEIYIIVFKTSSELLMP